jgi:hypothetical protein
MQSGMIPGGCSEGVLGQEEFLVFWRGGDGRMDFAPIGGRENVEHLQG